MSGSFAASASKLAGLAGAVLGWRPDEFWRATPTELEAVLRAMVGEAEAGIGSDDVMRLMEVFPDG